jgi:hypothetical protein
MTRNLIEASTQAAGFPERLARKAQAIAEARLSVRRGDPRRWRNAGWLWPLFAKER